MIATARMKFVTEARPSQNIVPFGDTDTILTLYGH